MNPKRGPSWKRKPYKPDRPPAPYELVMKEVHGKMVPVKVYEAQYARGNVEKLVKIGFKSGRITPDD
jgi:hypothetical protein